MKPLIVGEQNPYGPDPEFALYPSPPGCAGWRLCHKVLGLDPDDYCERFDRCNLLEGEKWSTKRAQEAAAKMLVRDNFILLGSKVAAAFGWSGNKPPTRVGFDFKAGPDAPAVPLGPRYFLIPHPSGRCRAWGDPTMVPRVRELLKEFLP